MSPRTLGRYRMDRLLGAGAFGKVYRASLHGAMGFTKSVAIKVLASDRPGYDPRQLGTFVNEALLGENLHHPNIVAIHEFGQDGDVYYLVMEYVDGVSLREVLSICAGRGVVLPQDAVCELGTQVCAGLDHAHKASTRDNQPMQLIHRDLKPANLLLDRTGTVRIGDFGVARAAVNPYFTTQAGEVKGTPRYMAPEQVTGETRLTPALDVYSLGLVLCEVATGEPVFTAMALEPLLHKVLTADTDDALTLLADEAPALHPVVKRALARAPEDRYPTASEMGAALRRVWLQLGGHKRLTLVAEATLPLRPGRRGGGISPVKTAEVPVVREPEPGASPWQYFCDAFADQLGPRSPVVDVEPAQAGRGWFRQYLWAALGLLALAALGSVAIRGVLQPPPDSEAIDVATSQGQPTEPDPPSDAVSPAVGQVHEPAQQPAESLPEVRPPVPEEQAEAAPPPEEAPARATTSGPGWFKVNSRPWSEVWVDGRPLGQTGVPSFEVPAGHHVVRLVRPPPGGDKSYIVDVPVGATVDLGCWDFEISAVCGG